MNNNLKDLKKKYEELGREIERLEKKKELPTKWEELDKISGFYIDSNSKVRGCFKEIYDYEDNKNMFHTKEQAEASIVLAQLSQLMYVYNDGWEPDWTNNKEDKYVIHFYRENIIDATFIESRRFLAFKTAKIRDLFLENFRDLIEQAKPLL